MALRIELGRHLASYDGVTLLVTHDAIDALTIADRVLVLDEGRVAQVGTPAEVVAAAAHRARRPAGRAQRRPRRGTADGVHPGRGRGVARRSPSARPGSAGTDGSPTSRRTATRSGCWSTPSPT